MLRDFPLHKPLPDCALLVRVSCHDSAIRRDELALTLRALNCLRRFRRGFTQQGPARRLQIPFFMIKQSNDMIALIDGHDQRL